jgi:hypothetical protein
MDGCMVGGYVGAMVAAWCTMGVCLILHSVVLAGFMERLISFFIFCSRIPSSVPGMEKCSQVSGSLAKGCSLSNATNHGFQNVCFGGIAAG